MNTVKKRHNEVATRIKLCNKYCFMFNIWRTRNRETYQFVLKSFGQETSVLIYIYLFILPIVSS